MLFLAATDAARRKQSWSMHKNTNSAAVGDKALLLAQIAPTIVARDRTEGARLAERKGAEIIIMDDGHQNFALVKDLSLIVVDGESGFGNGQIISGRTAT